MLLHNMHAIPHTIACSNNAIAINILLILLHFSIAIMSLLYCHWYSDLVLQNTFSFIHYYFYCIVNCCMYRAATGGIHLLKQWPGDKPAMQNNIWSHELGSSSSPDPMYIVAFSAIRFTGMGYPKVVLESKAAAAVGMIRATAGRELPCHPHNIYSQLHGLVSTPARMPHPSIRPVGWVGSVFPSKP